LESPDELLSWSDEEVESEILCHLPASTLFVCDWHDGVWSARVESGGSLAFAFEHVDRRMALYAVYGHLWLRGHRPPPPGSQWDVSAPRPTIVSVTRHVQSSLADPEDLDPVQVASVYGLSSQKG
jgi:hypothetical protein